MSESKCCSCCCSPKDAAMQAIQDGAKTESKPTEEEKEDQGTKIVAPKDFAGPTGERSCTDCFCLLLLLALWAAMTAVGADGIINGNPYVLVNGLDEQGRICGVDSGVEDQPYWYALNIYGQGVCVEHCPSETQTLVISTDMVDEMICISALDTTDERFDYLTDDCDMTDSDNWGKCECNFAIKSKPVAGYCWITEEEAYDFAALFADAIASDSYITELFGDIFLTKHVIYGFGLGVSLCLAFVYAVFLRLPYIAVLIVWGSICFVGAAMAIMSWIGWVMSDQWENEDPQIHKDYEIRSIRIFSASFIAVTVTYWAIMIVLRKRINLAIGIVKESAEALTDMPAIIFSPIFQLIGFIIFMIPWLIYCFFTASLGEVTVERIEFDDDSMPSHVDYKSFTYDNDAKNRGWFLLFCFLWTANFILAFGQLHIALCFSTWYFTKGSKKEIGNMTVFKTMKTIFRYHLGTIAFGSFIIALIEFIRAVVMYIQKQAKKSKNRMLELMMKILQCFLWCLEKCMKFINKNAYIQTAIFGYSFCKATKEAFFLILRNILRVGAVSVVSQFIIIIGRMFVTVGTGFLAYFYIIVRYETKVNNVASPTVCAMLLAYITATMFFEIFSMGIDTILQCFIADEEMFENPDDRFAEEDLKAWINVHGAKKPKKGEDKHEDANPKHIEDVKPKATETVHESKSLSKSQEGTTEPSLSVEELSVVVHEGQL